MASNYWHSTLKRRTLDRRRMLGLIGGGLGATALAAACGSDDKQDAPSGKATLGEFTPSVGSPQPGGRLLGQTVTLANFNPVEPFGGGLAASHVYDRPLTSREDTRRYVLEAMETIETPDPVTVIMKLKPGMTYHDFAPVNGRAVKASDIVATQQYVLDLPSAFDKTFQRDYVSKVEAPDDRTVIFRLKKPNAYLFSVSGLGNGSSQVILPPETFDNLATAKQIGSGPYFLDSAQLNGTYLYKRFPRYHQAAKNLPYIAEKEYRTINDSAAQEASFRSGQTDIWTTATPTQIATVPREMGDKMRLFKLPAFNGRAFQLNMDRGFPWQTDVRVREAFWRLINRKQVLDLAESGEGVVPTGVLPVSLAEYQLDAKDTDSYFAEDVAKAKQLLSASGFDLNKDWQFFAGAVFVQSEVAQVLQQLFARAGIKTHVETVGATSQAYQRWSVNDWEIQISAPPGGDTPAQQLRNQHTKGWSDVYRRFALMDPQIDALIEKSEETVDHQENVRLVKQVQLEVIKKFTSHYLLHTPNSNTMLQERVQNYELTLASPVYRHDMWLRQS